MMVGIKMPGSVTSEPWIGATLSKISAAHRHGDWSGISKSFDKRYNLVDFGLGFMRLALETGTPIVPVAVIGGEEQYISVGNFASLAKLLRMPNMPILPQLLLPFGVLPLPTRYRIYFGEPMRFEGDPDDDDAVIEEKVFVVKATIQSMINRGLKARKSVFF